MFFEISENENYLLYSIMLLSAAFKDIYIYINIQICMYIYIYISKYVCTYVGSYILVFKLHAAILLLSFSV